MCYIDKIHLETRLGSVTGCCEHSDDIFGHINDGKLPEYLSELFFQEKFLPIGVP